MGSGTDGGPHIATFNLWNDERNVNVNRNDNDWNDNWWFAGRRNSSFPGPALMRGLVLFGQLTIPAAEHSADLLKRN